MIGIFLTVLDEGDRLRLWYFTSASEKEKSFVGYAESTDGVHWSKPALGLVERDGSRRNNLLPMPGFEGAVFRNREGGGGEEERYLCLANREGEGVIRYHSRDGIAWRRDKALFLPFRSDTQNVGLWDERLGRYVVYLRAWDVAPGWDQRLRTVGRIEVERLDRPAPVTPLEKGRNPHRADLPRLTDEVATVFRTDAGDPPGADVYNLSALRYPADPRWYLGFPSIMDHRGGPIGEGRLEVHFAGSRDGVRWERYDRTPYVPLGPEGSPTGGMLYMGTGMVIRGDEIWQYGPAFRTDHGEPLKRRRTGDGVIYRYVQRLDGFVALEFGPSPGHCLTKPVRVDGGRLFVNARVGEGGSLRVTLADEHGADLTGFASAECLPPGGDSVRARVRWGGDGDGDGADDLSSLAGRAVRLRFHGRRARLFSFYFGGGAQAGE